ncbi:MAG: hypothetical protein ACXVPQ_04815 [Bacteroidia bacterium]
MDQHLNAEERELTKLVKFFKKRAERLTEEQKAEQDYTPLIETCDKLVEQLHAHADKRQIILAEREQLNNLVKDNAQCPKCKKADQLKNIGIDKSEQGWKSNKYKCRRCNIEFVWNAPNNPWDMIPYVEQVVSGLEAKAEESPEETKQQMLAAIAQMKANIAKLKPVVEASDLDMAELEEREKEMSNIVRQFKKQLMIEKIRMDD